MKDSDYPMRINRYLAQKGLATRRGADELIQKGIVFINGLKAPLGAKVDENDVVEVRGKRTKQQRLSYFAYHKPAGVITHSPAEDETSVTDELPGEARALGLFPVGRLDKDSRGLMILTNDGRITDPLLNPECAHDKEYIVRTKLPVREGFKKQMEEGVYIEGYQTKPAFVRLRGDHEFSIVLTEGKKHQIRRMVVALRNEVTDLKRVRVLNITLGSLKPGALRPIEGPELAGFLEHLRLPGLN